MARYFVISVGLVVLCAGCGDPAPPPQQSPASKPEPHLPKARVEPPGAILQDYVARQRSKDAVVAWVEKGAGRPFIEWTQGDYTRWISGLDLDRDDDLWEWSHVTGIPIIGLTRRSTFFYCNAHLLEDTEAALEMPYEELVSLERGYDRESQSPTLHTAGGQALRLRDIPAGTVRLSARTGSFSHDEDYAEPRTDLEVLAPYLVKLSEIPNRPYISRGLHALPLSIVQAYRGKAIYLITQPARSYAVGMPVSNSVYTAFAGMQAGFFLGRATGALTTHNLVHELGHVIDYTGIAGQYGRYLHPYQIPTFRELKEEKDRIFGKGDAKVPQTSYGYITRYAKANAQESFAEHFASYILNQESFFELAETELDAGHPELMDKYRFLETLVDYTPVTTTRLSRQYLEELEESSRIR
jgi:hypothetical protein